MEFLRDRGEYSNRKFASEVGFKSSSFLRMVIQGTRTLNHENIEKLIQAFQLDKREAEFFQLLVQFDQAENPKAADEVYRRILQNEAFRRVRQMAQAEYDFFSSWHMIAILEAVSTSFGQFSEVHMAETVGIDIKELKRTLKLLKDLKLIDYQHNRWVRLDRQIETPLDVQGLNVRNFHREMAKRAIEMLDQVPSEERTFAGMTINLSPEGYLDFRKRIFEFLRECNAIYSEQEKSDVVYQVNVQLFPLLKVIQAPKSTSQD